MKAAAKSVWDDTQSINLLPRWVTSSHGEAIETVAFSSGAALAMLDVVLGDPCRLAVNCKNAEVLLSLAVNRENLLARFSN